MYLGKDITFCKEITNSPSRVSARGGRLEHNQKPMSQFKASLKLPPRKTGDMLAVGEVLELGQVSCSSAELPISADLAGPSRP